MPRQNTRPSDFPAPVLQHIQQLAAGLVAHRKAQGATQAQWAAQLGVSQPTMARLERGDPSVSAATYVMCLSMLNPQLDLSVLLPLPARMDAAALKPPPSLAPTPALAPALAPAENTANSSAVDEFASLLGAWPSVLGGR